MTATEERRGLTAADCKEIREWCEARKVGIGQLSVRIGRSYSFLANAMGGRSAVGPDDLKKLKKELSKPAGGPARLAPPPAPAASTPEAEPVRKPAKAATWPPNGSRLVTDDVAFDPGLDLWRCKPGTCERCKDHGPVDRTHFVFKASPAMLDEHLKGEACPAERAAAASMKRPNGKVFGDDRALAGKAQAVFAKAQEFASAPVPGLPPCMCRKNPCECIDLNDGPPAAKSLEPDPVKVTTINLGGRDEENLPEGLTVASFPPIKCPHCGTDEHWRGFQKPGIKQCPCNGLFVLAEDGKVETKGSLGPIQSEKLLSELTGTGPSVEHRLARLEARVDANHQLWNSLTEVVTEQNDKLAQRLDQNERDVCSLGDSHGDQLVSLDRRLNDLNRFAVGLREDLERRESTSDLDGDQQVREQLAQVATLLGQADAYDQARKFEAACQNMVSLDPDLFLAVVRRVWGNRG